jgi:hypothetical protein
MINPGITPSIVGGASSYISVQSYIDSPSYRGGYSGVAAQYLEVLGADGVTVVCLTIRGGLATAYSTH